MGAVGSAFEDVWDGIGDAAEWGVNAIGDAAEWTIDNVPGADIAADAAGVFGDVVLAPVKLGGKVMDEVAKMPGFEWADDAFDIAEDIIEEVNSNASPLHMAAYAARDAKTLKDAVRTKQKIELNNKAIERANAAEDAAEASKHLKYLLRGKGNASKGLASRPQAKATAGAKAVTKTRSGRGAASRGAASSSVAKPAQSAAVA